MPREQSAQLAAAWVAAPVAQRTFLVGSFPDAQLMGVPSAFFTRRFFNTGASSSAMMYVFSCADQHGTVSKTESALRQCAPSARGPSCMSCNSHAVRVR